MIDVKQFRRMCGLDEGKGSIGIRKAEMRELLDRLEEAERHAESIADAVGFPAHNDNRCKTSVITHCIENMRRFSDYLHAIEQEFFMTPGEPDDDYPDEEPDPECLVNSWGARSRDHYVEQFRGAFARLIAEKQAEALERLLDPNYMSRRGNKPWPQYLLERCNELRLQVGDLRCICGQFAVDTCPVCGTHTCRDCAEVAEITCCDKHAEVSP